MKRVGSSRSAPLTASKRGFVLVWSPGTLLHFSQLKWSHWSQMIVFFFVTGEVTQIFMRNLCVLKILHSHVKTPLWEVGGSAMNIEDNLILKKNPNLIIEPHHFLSVSCGFKRGPCKQQLKNGHIQFININERQPNNPNHVNEDPMEAMEGIVGQDQFKAQAIYLRILLLPRFTGSFQKLKSQISGNETLCCTSFIQDLILRMIIYSNISASSIFVWSEDTSRICNLLCSHNCSNCKALIPY